MSLPKWAVRRRARRCILPPLGEDRGGKVKLPPCSKSAPTPTLPCTQGRETSRAPTQALPGAKRSLFPHSPVPRSPFPTPLLLFKQSFERNP
jgi:hypothetical protein